MSLSASQLHELNEKKKNASYVHELNEKRKKELEEEEERKRQEKERELAESAFNTLNNAKFSSTYQEAVNLSKAASTASLAGLKANEKEDDIVDLTDKYGKEAPAGDTDLAAQPYRDPFANIKVANENFINSLKMQADEMSYLGTRLKSDAADALNFFGQVGQGLPMFNLDEIQAEAIKDYANGKRDVGTQLAYEKLKFNVATLSPEEKLLVPDLINMLDSIENGTYKGNAQNIIDTFNDGKRLIYLNWYDQTITPVKQELREKQKYNEEKYPIGGFMNFAGDTGASVYEIMAGGALGVNPTVGFGVQSALTQDSEQSANYLRNGGNLSTTTNNAVINAAKSMAFAKLFQYASPLAKVGTNPAAQTIKGKLANYARVFVQSLATAEGINLTTQALNFLKEDPLMDFIDWNAYEKGVEEGRYKSLEDYTNSEEFEKHLVGNIYAQTLVSSLFHAIVNTGSYVYGDIQNGKQAKVNAEELQAQFDEDLKTLGLERGATQEEIKKTYREFVKRYMKQGDVAPENRELWDKVVNAYARLDVAITNGTYKPGTKPRVSTQAPSYTSAEKPAPTDTTPRLLPEAGQQTPNTNLPANFNSVQSQQPQFDATPIVQAAANEQYTEKVLNSIKISENAQKEIDNIIERHRNSNDSLSQTLNAIADTIAYDNGFLDEDALPFGGYREEDAVMQKAREIYDDAVKKRLENQKRWRANANKR